MYLKKVTDTGLIFEGGRLPGWVAVTYFGGIFLATVAPAVVAGDWLLFLISFLCGFGLLAGVPFLLLFVVVRYPRVVIETHRLVRKENVSRVFGPATLFELVWDSVTRVTAEKVFETVGEDHDPQYSWRLTAETTDGRSHSLCKLIPDNAGDEESLNPLYVVLEEHFGPLLTPVL